MTAPREKRGTVFPPSSTAAVLHLKSPTRGEAGVVKVGEDEEFDEASFARPAKRPRAGAALNVPTKAALDSHNLIINDRDPWRLFEGVQFTTWHGTGLTATIAVTTEREPLLRIIKFEPGWLKRKSIVKPMHPNIVTIQQVFRSALGLEVVYDCKTHTSLETLLLQDEPWSFDNSGAALQHPRTEPSEETLGQRAAVFYRHKAQSIASVTEQILGGLHYVHTMLKISHGDMTTANVLLERSGHVYIANIHKGLLEGGRSMKEDLECVAEIFLDMHDPHKDGQASDLETTAQRFHASLCIQSSGDLLKNTWLRQASIISLMRTLGHAFKFVFEASQAFGPDEKKWLELCQRELS